MMDRVRNGETGGSRAGVERVDVQEEAEAAHFRFDWSRLCRFTARATLDHGYGASHG